MIYLSDTTEDAVHAAADALIEAFHQSSVLIQANPTTTEFYGGAAVGEAGSEAESGAQPLEATVAEMRLLATTSYQAYGLWSNTSLPRVPRYSQRLMPSRVASSMSSK